MTQPSLIGRQRALVRDLASVAAEKAQAEPALARTFQAEHEAAERAFEHGRASLELRLTQTTEALDEALRRSQDASANRWAAELEAAQKDHAASRLELTDRFDAEKELAESAVQEARWAADAMLEGRKGEAATKLRENNARLEMRIKELQALHVEARALLAGWNQPVAELEEQALARARSEQPPLRKITECIQAGTQGLDDLRELVAPRYLTGARLPGLALLLGLVLIFPLGWLIARLLELQGLPAILGLGAVAGAVVAVAVGLTARAILKARARKQIEQLYFPFCAVLLTGEATRQQLLKRYQAEHDQFLAEAQGHYQRDLAKAQTLQQKLAEIAKRRSAALAQLEERLRAQRTASETAARESAEKVERKHAQGTALATQEHDSALQQLQAEYQARRDEINTRHLREWQALVARWQQVLAGAEKIVTQVNEESDEIFPGWDDPSWKDWQPPSAPPPVMRFGSFEVQAGSVVEAPPWTKPRSQPTPPGFTLPALWSRGPEPASILLHAHDEGRDRAVEALQTIMFRLLTSVPPGRVRFMIVDPVGLGQNFAAFMNLSDYDEALVGGRIWTEAPHIEQRLADLTAHMENVIQKYLRNRYATISEYNAQAGEVAEPFRVLVVANFPANFTPEAARRLLSIAQSGPRCGVSTLISIDTRQELPRGFDLADLERCGENLTWEGEEFRWRDADFGPFPLRLDRLPADSDFFTSILQRVGEAARNAQRVEVPFEFIAPAEPQWWTGSSRLGISVALGRAGATRRQHLELGKGTSQHVLIVGKTGSGKSTLMHALITNLSLFYSPDEVELYLVDFKKGVEFKTYAVHELPHARVVAIESEREFGLSVLQRLDAELKMRGERFRAAGAQDINAYRQAVPEARAPRILLIVDEFQELFVEDDRITQESAQLLDRLVRQGRAFGMHVLLGSQTLGGAYSLARSTIDQMAVRIALQCSEVDAHLILSDDNSAARLLSRPGEAIYNDANGLVEGNDPFQVVWLGEEQREHYLTRVHELAEQRPLLERRSAVIFEGNASADVRRNHYLNRLLKSGAQGADGEEEAWLGEAMAIDQLTSAVFRRRNGSNLLIVGQQPETALGMLATGVIGLTAHAPVAASASSQPRFFIIDGHQADAPRTGVLASLPDLLSGQVRLGGWRDLPALLAEVSAELDQRQKVPSAGPPAIYLVLYGLQRMRDLRRQEDDFGFSSRSEEQPATPDRQLATILREGAALGVHTLIWCDTLNNLNRALDRQALRELVMRVVFQLNVADSSNLIDSPAASKLGPHRALFSNEEDGRLEKFRPYGAPPEDWLARVREELRQRGAIAVP